MIVDDDRDMRWVMRNILADAGFDVAETDGGGAALEFVTHLPPAAVLLDMRMPGLSGDVVLRSFRRLDPALPIIIVTAHGSIPGAVSAIQDGAFEYVTKPFRNDDLLETVRRAVKRRSSARSATALAGELRAGLSAVMGPGIAIRDLAAQIEAVVATPYSVIIGGETGAGKEVVARCLHEHGPRANQPLVVVDCGAITESLTDNELFGHEKAAFTGAGERRRGYIEAAANGGTIFLDEVGNLAPTGQKALLRTLENRSIRRVGGTELIDLDIRVIAASNEDLRERTRGAAFARICFSVSPNMSSRSPLCALDPRTFLTLRIAF